jgi:hypothetical protein
MLLCNCCSINSVAGILIALDNSMKLVNLSPVELLVFTRLELKSLAICYKVVF